MSINITGYAPSPKEKSHDHCVEQSAFKKMPGGFIYKGEPFDICVTKEGQTIELNTAIYQICKAISEFKSCSCDNDDDNFEIESFELSDDGVLTIKANDNSSFSVDFGPVYERISTLEYKCKELESRVKVLEDCINQPIGN